MNDGSPFFISASEGHITREKAKARTLRQSQWWKRKRSTGRCHYCGGRFPPQELTMDHVVPLIRGGHSVKGNVVPCCAECNAAKQHKLPIEWEAYLQQLRRDTGD